MTRRQRLDYERPMAKKARRAKLSRARLREMIEEATVDAYNESEQATGWACVLEDKLELPFETIVLGVAVQVVGMEVNKDNSIVAVCQRGGSKQRIPLADLPLPTKRLKGAEWIEAYKRWLKGSW